jgi:hypothetical protein
MDHQLDHPLKASTVAVRKYAANLFGSADLRGARWWIRTTDPRRVKHEAIMA